jgi:hypothetical protein
MSKDARIRFDTKFPRASITRPANTTNYTAGDVVSDVTANNHFVFEKSADRVVSGYISGAIIISSVAASTELDGELWLFREDVAKVADNAAFAPTDAELLTLLGVIDFPTASWKAAGAAGAICDVDFEPKAYRVNALSTDGAVKSPIYGQLVARNAYVPTSGEVFTIILKIQRN